MNNNILIFCTLLSTCSLMAFTYMSRAKPAPTQRETACRKTVTLNDKLVNRNNEGTNLDLFYDVNSRFITTITKENLEKARSIIDILPREATQAIVAYHAVRVSMLDDNQETDQQATGDSEVLNTAQMKLLQATDYHSDFYIRADYQLANEETRTGKYRYLTYFISVVPEKEAAYEGGQQALIKYLRENSREETAIIKQDKLQPGKVTFTVTKKGTVTNVTLTSTSGYPSLDEALVKLITNLPERWDPATNSKGEKVDQKLVFFFGLEGC